MNRDGADSFNLSDIPFLILNGSLSFRKDQEH